MLSFAGVPFRSQVVQHNVSYAPNMAGLRFGDGVLPCSPLVAAGFYHSIGRPCSATPLPCPACLLALAWKLFMDGMSIVV
jgi:hypothetical protein